MKQETEFFHLCPKCGKKCFHKSKSMLTNFEWRMKSGKTKGWCHQCLANDEDLKQKKLDYYKTHDFPMSGRTVYDIWVEKYGVDVANQRREEHRKHVSEAYHSMTDEQKAEHAKKSARIGSQNGMYGKSIYERWVELYGIEEADRKYAIWHEKIKSNAKTGKDNPNFGKSPAIGSGNGWSGWYKGWYFRSLKELTYMIDVIEANSFTWKGVETKDFNILCEIDGKQHVYHGDFLVNDKIFVEIKPKRLMNTKINVAKKEAALKFCKEHGYEYRMVDVKNISEDRLIGLFEEGQVTFIEKYNKRMVEKCRLKKHAQ